MSTQALAEVLVEMLKDDNFHKKIRKQTPEILLSLSARGLTPDEVSAVSSSVERWEASLLEVANVGAWKLVTTDLVNISEGTNLNYS